jgi:putative membrane protein
MVPKILILLTIIPHLRFALPSSIFEWLAPENRKVPFREGTVADAMSSNGLYNGFLFAALGLALCYPDPEVARGFAWFWLVSFVIGSVWDAATSRADGRDHAFLVGVLCLGLFDTTPEMAEAFSIFGLACVIASGLRYAWIGMQPGGLINCSMPAALALTAVVGRL